MQGAWFKIMWSLAQNVFSREISEKGPLQLTLRLEPSVARLRLACATEDGIPVSCLADVGGERLELSDDGVLLSW